MIGGSVSPSQHLMAAGLDSRGAMELRHHLGAPLRLRARDAWAMCRQPTGRIRSVHTAD